jgi:uncharacterized protein YecT (DUF1311 family)
MKTILISLLFITHFIGMVALPQQKAAGISPCESNSGTQAEANACARRKYNQADAEMSRVYEQLLLELSKNRYGGKDKQKFRQAQSRWLKYCDANCESEASIYEGGSIRPAIYYTCLGSITEERTKRMRAFLAVMRQ